MKDSVSPPLVLFGQLLGAGFARTPAAVQQLHAREGDWRGEARVTRGAGWFANLCCTLAGLPPTQAVCALQVKVRNRGMEEIWERAFGTVRMRSRLWAVAGCVVERLGPLDFHFALQPEADGLHWLTCRVRLLGRLPLPLAWFHAVHCVEGQDAAGRYTFEIRAGLPLIGRVIDYEGWLEPAA